MQLMPQSLDKTSHQYLTAKLINQNDDMPRAGYLWSKLDHQPAEVL
jgi:hypothetical protein